MEWLPLITAICSFVGPFFTWWLKRKVSRDFKAHDQIDSAVHDEVLKNTEALSALHSALNSRLDEWKRETRDTIQNLVESALAEGIAKGIEIERNRKS